MVNKQKFLIFVSLSAVIFIVSLALGVKAISNTPSANGLGVTGNKMHQGGKTMGASTTRDSKSQSADNSKNTSKGDPASVHSSVTATSSVPQAADSSLTENSQNSNAVQTAPASPIAESVQVSEQFSGNTLDERLWEKVTRLKGYRNNEEQAYNPAQVKVENGNLLITASRDASGAWKSGEVNSKWAYTYGDFEVRLALSDTGPGVWPAAWLMGTTSDWPNGGEIDIFENVNGIRNVFGTVHGGGSGGHWQLQKYYSPIDVTQYHTYRIVKKPGLIMWWVDGVLQGEWRQSQIPAGSIWPYENHKNFGLLNLAIGGSWPGPSDATTPDDVTMKVDYFTVKNAY